MSEQIQPEQTEKTDQNEAPASFEDVYAVSTELVRTVEAALEDNDDVQRVAANFDVDDEILERLSA